MQLSTWPFEWSKRFCGGELTRANFADTLDTHARSDRLYLGRTRRAFFFLRGALESRLMDPAIVTSLDACVSPARLAPYLAACNNVPEQARRLYVWNMEVSAAFWGAISSVEVAMRNAVHAEFAAHFGRQDWWHDQAVSQIATEAVATETKLRQVLRRQSSAVRSGRGPIGPDDVVAALSFGFWSTMVASPKQALEQNTYWNMFVHKGFPNWSHQHNNTTARKAFLRRVENLRKFRNRVAHHEPIHARNLVDDNRKVIEMARYLDADLAHFINGHSRVPASLARRGAAVQFGDCTF